MKSVVLSLLGLAVAPMGAGAGVLIAMAQVVPLDSAILAGLIVGTQIRNEYRLRRLEDHRDGRTK